MKPDKLYSLISDANQLDESTLVELQELIKKYPYFQTLRILWNYNLAKLQNVQTAEYLKQTATFAGDRSKLLGLFQKTLHGVQTAFVPPVFAKTTVSSSDVQSKQGDSTQNIENKVAVSDRKHTEHDDAKTKNTEAVKETSKREVEEKKEPVQQVDAAEDEQNDRFKPRAKESALDIAERKARERQEREAKQAREEAEKEALLKPIEEQAEEKIKQEDAGKEMLETEMLKKEVSKSTVVSEQADVLSEKKVAVENVNTANDNSSQDNEEVLIASSTTGSNEEAGETVEITSDISNEEDLYATKETSKKVQGSVEVVVVSDVSQIAEPEKTVQSDEVQNDKVGTVESVEDELIEQADVNALIDEPKPIQKPSYLGGSVQSRPMKEDYTRRVVSQAPSTEKSTSSGHAFRKGYHPVDENNLVSFFKEGPKLHSVSTQVEIDAPTITRPLSEEDVESFIQQEVIKMRADSTPKSDTLPNESEELDEEVLPGDFEGETVELLDHEKMIDALIGNLRKVRDNGGATDGGEDEIDRLLGETTFKKKNEAYNDILSEKPAIVHKSTQTLKEDLFEIEATVNDSVQGEELNEVSSHPQVKEYQSGSLVELAIDALEQMKAEKAEKENAVVDFEIERNEEEVIEIIEEKESVDNTPILDTAVVVEEVENKVSTIDAPVEIEITQPISVNKDETVAERVLRQVAEKRMKLRKEKDEADTDNRSEEEKKKLNPTNSRRNDQLLDRFIQDEPRLERAVPNQPQSDLEEAQSSIQENEDIVTEAIANLYVAQKYYAKAISAYQKLSLKFPEKNTYFADQIENVKKLMNRE